MKTKPRLFIAATVFACAIAALIAIGASAIAMSLEAEKTLHAVHYTALLVEQFVSKNDGRWPTSWEDLETVRMEPSAGYSWPQDRRTLEKRVWIDFNVDETRLSAVTLHSFDLIKPIGPCYEGYERFFIPIIQEVRGERPEEETVPM